jgi:flagellar motility protein MotE (MotC chaperone)
MMKILVYILVPAISFVATLAACLALTGNLNPEALKRLIAPQPAEEPAVEQPQGEVEALVQTLQRREEDLNKREAQIREQEERAKKERADLEALRTELQTIQKQIGDALKGEDADQQERVMDVATSLAKMKPISAAGILSAWTPEETAKVLRQVKDKERGKILDAMPPEKAAAVLTALQSPKL